MHKSITVAAIIIASAATSACGHAHAEGAGPTVTRNYQVGNFEQIEVAGPYDVDVRTGGNASVSARGGQNILERTTVEVRGDKLVIRPEENQGWFHWGWHSHGHARFTVTVPVLNGATIAGSGGIDIDHLKGDRFAGSVAGSGDLHVATMEVGALKLSIAGSGGIKAGNGRAQSAEYSIAGSGDLDAGSIQTQQAKVSIMGSGGVKANAATTADVSIMGSGDVAVAGGAKCAVHKAGSGSVSCS